MDNILFPPIVDSYINTFQIKTAYYYEDCKIYFSLSDFNAFSDISSVQAVVYNKKTNRSVVNTTDDNINLYQTEPHYRKTGIILNLKPHKVENETNLFYVEIYNKDLNSDNAVFHIDTNDGTSNNTTETEYKGWIPGEIYRIQLRLSKIDYEKNPDGTQPKQEEQVNDNNNKGNFSEWSRTCVVKPIGKIRVTIPLLEFDTDEEDDPYTRKTIYSSTFDIIGKFSEVSKTEDLYSFNVKIYRGSDAEVGTLLEDSGEQFTNNQADPNEFKYLCKTEFEDLEYYTIRFKFTTKNQFVYETQTIVMVSLARVDISGISIYTIEDIEGFPSEAEDPQGIYKRVRDELSTTSISQEQEEGRVALKLFSNETNPFYGNFYVRRSSSKDDFKYWYDIKLITLKDIAINEIPMFYDYTIESGVWYKYGIQYVDNDGYRGILYHETDKSVKREFEYSFLLGQNNQQLKLMFDNTMQNYKIQVLDSKSETIGSKYPRVTRNGAVRYKIFPITGLISTQMDENKLFCSKETIYSSEEVLKLYNEQIKEGYTDDPNYQSDKPILQQYDYTYERDFRDKVMDFLHDGKPKLFKSPTEGNVIVRLMDIECTPIQSLDRMLYSFTSNGNQIAESTIENYAKWGFLEVDELKSNLSTKKTLLGQICMEFDTGALAGSTPTNIFKAIYDKHNRTDNNYGGYNRKLINIHHVRITFEDQSLRIQNLNSGDYLLGNNIEFKSKGAESGTVISVINALRMYTFDERLTFTKDDSLIILPDAEGKVQKVKAIVDYLYDVEDSVYVGKKITSKKLDTYLGQFYDKCNNGDSIYKKIADKYYIEWKDRFQRLNTLSSVEIEAQPGMAVYVRDQMDPIGLGEIHVVNESGILNLSRIANISDLTVLGAYDVRTQTINPIKPKDADWNFLVNYHCTVLSGTYDVEEQES